LRVEPREQTGTGPMRRLRRDGKVPGILYGGGRDNLSVQLEHDQVMHSLEVEAFHSAIIMLRYGEIEQRVILRDVQMHPFKRQCMHVDLQRVSDTEKLRISLPLHLNGAEDAPGIQIDGGMMSALMTDIEIQCLPKDLPEYLDLDVSQMAMNDILHLSDIKLPEGVEIMQIVSGGEDLAVASVVPQKTVEEEEPVDAEDGEDAEGADGEDAPDAEGGADGGGDDDG